MLEFYLIPDYQSKPEWPEQANLTFAGDLDLPTYERLQRIGLIESRYDYYTDFRWSSDIVRQKHYQIFNDRSDSNTDVKKLYTILSKAKSGACGLQTYCD